MLKFLLLMTTTMAFASPAQAPYTAPSVPQNQMGAAALLVGQVLLQPLWLGTTIEVVDEQTAIIHSDGHGDADVIKVDDCHFNAVRSPSVRASGGSLGPNELNKFLPRTPVVQVDLSVLGTEYVQGRDRLGWPQFTIRGNGKAPAVCAGQGCFASLSLGPFGDGLDSAARLLRAIQFLQQYCPPAASGF